MERASQESIHWTHIGTVRGELAVCGRKGADYVYRPAILRGEHQEYAGVRMERASQESIRWTHIIGAIRRELAVCDREGAA